MPSFIRTFLNDNVLSRFRYKLIRVPAFASDTLPSRRAHPAPNVPPAPHVREAVVQSAVNTNLVRSPIRKLKTITELDAILLECDRAQRVSDDALRAVFQSFEFLTEALNLPADPDSPEYRNVQLDLYHRISGREYSTNNEASNWLVVDDAIKVPFPYYTKSFQTVSAQMIAIGLIIKTMQLPPGAHILEFGPGWGNTTVTLARMGYKVTAIDIESRFLDIIRGRSVGFDENITTITGDFSNINDLYEDYDAILFYESFHHCSDHQSLIAALAQKLRPNGIVVFAAEPITDAFPMPWGVRLDGESLWATRNFGWLELGFQETYFRALLERHGWTVEKHNYDVTPLGVIFVSRRK